MDFQQYVNSAEMPCVHLRWVCTIPFSRHHTSCVDFAWIALRCPVFPWHQWGTADKQRAAELQALQRLPTAHLAEQVMRARGLWPAAEIPFFFRSTLGCKAHHAACSLAGPPNQVGKRFPFLDDAGAAPAPAPAPSLPPLSVGDALGFHASTSQISATERRRSTTRREWSYNLSRSWEEKVCRGRYGTKIFFSSSNSVVTEVG